MIQPKYAYNSQVGRWLRRAGGALLLAGALGLSASSGAAQADPDEGKVAVGGEHILTVRFPSGNMSILERAQVIEQRLVEILSDPSLRPADIRVGGGNGGPARIIVKNRLLVTVDAATARFNQMTPLALAEKWAAHLRQVLPKVNYVPNPNAMDEGDPPRVP
jgi:hypothetical protein